MLTCSETVTPGNPVTVIIHNNGCTGETIVTKIKDELGGSLTGANFDGSTLRHYNRDRLTAWRGSGSTAADNSIAQNQTDQTLTYTAARCGGEDVYTFPTDGVTLTATFSCATSSTGTQTGPNGSQTGTNGSGTSTQMEPAVQLDFPFGIYPAGTIIPLRRITGGNTSGSDVACNSEHLHGPFIVIDSGAPNAQGPGEDPNPSGCGYGRIIQLPRTQRVITKRATQLLPGRQ